MDGKSAQAESVSTTLKQFASGFDQQFSKFLEAVKHAPASLIEAMRYSAMAPGKRLRPYLVTEFCRLVGVTDEAALHPAAAIECVHAFSLVHDDLPSMDDDDLRRGQPTCHVKFGEAQAILAGDALLALAFELLGSADLEAGSTVALVRELAGATGREGMIGGQVADIEGEGQPQDQARVEFIHTYKTGSLLQVACRMGVLAGGGDAEALERAGRYGLRLGLAFQIADDLLDVTSTADRLGKSVGKDARAGKQTYPACVGMEQARSAARSHADQAVAALDVFGTEAEPLRELAGYVVKRAC